MNYFFDLDGFLADFEGDFKRTFGREAGDYPTKKEMWNNIHNIEGFFENMSPMKGAIDFMDDVRIRLKIEPIILTAAPASKYEAVAKQKIKWVRKNLGDLFVIPTYKSESKPLFIQQPGDVLVDDYGKNIKAWEAAGGFGIKFDGDFDKTFMDLQEHQWAMKNIRRVA